jgi:O-antigen ligase
MIATAILRNSPARALLVALTAVASVWFMLMFPELFALAAVALCVSAAVVLVQGPAWIGLLLVGLAVVPVVRQEQTPWLSVGPLGGEGRVIAVVWLGGLAGLFVSKRPIRFPAKRATAGVVLYSLAMVIALVVAGSSSSAIPFSASWSFFVRQIAFVSIFFLPAVLLRDQSDMDKAVRIVLVAGVAYAAAGLVEWAGYHGVLHLPGIVGDIYRTAQDASPWGHRVTFPFVADSPNNVAMMGVMWLALLITTAVKYPSKSMRLFAAGGGMVVLAYILATESRTGFVGLAALVIGLPLALGAARLRWRLLLILVVLIVGVHAFWNELPQDRALSQESLGYQTRLELQKGGLNAFFAKPFLGHGLAYAEQPVFVATAPTGPEGLLAGENLPVHSQYLAEAVDKGIMGPLLLLGLFILLAAASRAAGRSPESAEAVLGTAWLAALGSVAVAMLAGTLLSGGAFATVFWLLSGLVACSGDRREQVVDLGEPSPLPVRFGEAR